jgi:hypothetical protein
VHDAVQFEALGRPATVLITDAFDYLAESFAAQLGLTPYHWATVSHPVASRNEEQLQAMAASVAGVVLSQLTRQS